MNHAEHYEMRLPYLRLLKNAHEKEASPDMPFLVIGPKSPVSWRKAVESMAYYFRREMHFDFPPYGVTETDFSPELGRDRVLVFPKTTVIEGFLDVCYFIGAVGVRWREWTDAPASWCVTWAWLHPYERRQGHLTKAWPFLLRTFPNTWVEPH